MSDDDVRRWAAQWVGWPDHRAHATYTNDLAEAVRARLIRDFTHKNDRQGWGNPSTWALLSGIWMNNGPLAFLRAVMEVVDG